MPPFAVPSILVSTMPVISATSANCLAWLSAFCPVVASSTTSVSRYAWENSRSKMRLIFRSSSIRFFLLCSLPAVSHSKISAFLAFAAATASNTTDAGSAPSCPPIISTPARLAHSASCPPAAARNVSAAPSTTFLPCALNFPASLPTVVVLPTPLTPMTSTTARSSSNR